jgi:hypothetical protein
VLARDICHNQGLSDGCLIGTPMNPVPATEQGNLVVFGGNGVHRCAKTFRRDCIISPRCTHSSRPISNTEPKAHEHRISIGPII